MLPATLTYRVRLHVGATEARMVWGLLLKDICQHLYDVRL